MADAKVTPTFRLQIVDRHGNVVVSPFAAGGALEMDFIEACVQAIAKDKRLFFRRTDDNVRRGIASAIQKLKDETRLVASHYR